MGRDVMVDKLRAELLALGYRRAEVDNLIQEMRKRKDTERLSPAAHKILSITLQEMLDFSRAADYQKNRMK